VQRFEEGFEIPFGFVPIADGNDDMLCEQTEGDRVKPRNGLTPFGPRSRRALGACRPLSV
jgi:hypothetical protein